MPCAVYTTCPALHSPQKTDIHVLSTPPVHLGAVDCSPPILFPFTHKQAETDMFHPREVAGLPPCGQPGYEQIGLPWSTGGEWQTSSNRIWGKWAPNEVSQDGPFPVPKTVPHLDDECSWHCGRKGSGEHQNTSSLPAERWSTYRVRAPVT